MTTATKTKASTKYLIRNYNRFLCAYDAPPSARFVFHPPLGKYIGWSDFGVHRFRHDLKKLVTLTKWSELEQLTDAYPELFDYADKWPFVGYEPGLQAIEPADWT